MFPDLDPLPLHPLDVRCIHGVTYEHCDTCGRSTMLIDGDKIVLAEGNATALHVEPDD